MTAAALAKQIDLERRGRRTLVALEMLRLLSPADALALSAALSPLLPLPSTLYSIPYTLDRYPINLHVQYTV